MCSTWNPTLPWTPRSHKIRYTKTKVWNLDAALMVADIQSGTCVDPATEAHIGPIGMWAKAAWHSWIKIEVLDLMVERSKAMPWGTTPTSASKPLMTDL